MRSNHERHTVLARRLIESGISLVQINWTRMGPNFPNQGGWDTHEKNAESHFGRAWTIVLADGGIRGGQHFGASNRDGFEVEENPVTEGDLFATIYRTMGINPRVRHYLGSRPIWATPEGSRPIQQLTGK